MNQVMMIDFPALTRWIWWFALLLQSHGSFVDLGYRVALTSLPTKVGDRKPATARTMKRN
jgi:hypothetical protein